MSKPTQPIIDILPDKKTAKTYYAKCYETWAQEENSILFEAIGKLYVDHAAKQIVDWLEKHMGEDTTGYRDGHVAYKTLPLSTWQALKALVEKKEKRK